MNRETLINKGYELLDIQSAKELISGLQEWKMGITNSDEENESGRAVSKIQDI